MGYFDAAIMHKDEGMNSTSNEKGTDGKKNNTSEYNHQYYMKNKDKWKDNDSTTKEIAGFSGLSENDIKKLRELAKSKGVDSEEYKKLLNELSKGDAEKAKKIDETLKKDREQGEAEFDIDAAALDVIRGKYKNGAERRAALGDDYELVQKRVNEMYKEGRFGNGSSGGSSSKNTDKKTTTKKSTPSKEEKAYKEKSEYYTKHYGTAKHSDEDQDSLAHHGILGQKWGVRRFQNYDGTRTAEGKRRERGESSGGVQNKLPKIDKETAKKAAIGTAAVIGTALIVKKYGPTAVRALTNPKAAKMANQTLSKNLKKTGKKLNKVGDAMLAAAVASAGSLAIDNILDKAEQQGKKTESKAAKAASKIAGDAVAGGIREITKSNNHGKNRKNSSNGGSKVDKNSKEYQRLFEGLDSSERDAIKSKANEGYTIEQLEDYKRETLHHSSIEEWAQSFTNVVC